MSELGKSTLNVNISKIDFSLVKKILIIQLTALGDIIQTFDLADILKQKYEVYFLVSDTYKSIVENKFKTLTINLNNLIDSKTINIETEKCLDEINSLDFDLVINLHSSEFTSNFVNFIKTKYFMGTIIKNKVLEVDFGVSYYLKYFISYINKSELKIFMPINDMFIYFAYQNLNLLKLKSLELKKKYIVIVPGGTWKSKKWPLEYFVEIINHISEKYSSYKIFVTGSKNEKKILEKISSKSGADIEIRAGSLSILELENLIKESELVISNDTGTLHLANYFNVLAITFIGPTITVPTGKTIVLYPENVNCLGCLKQNCPEKINCLSRIKPDLIKNIIDIIIEEDYIYMNIVEKLELYHNEIYFTNQKKMFLRLLIKNKKTKNLKFAEEYFKNLLFIYSLLSYQNSLKNYKSIYSEIYFYLISNFEIKKNEIEHFRKKIIIDLNEIILNIKKCIFLIRNDNLDDLHNIYIPKLNENIFYKNYIGLLLVILTKNNSDKNYTLCFTVQKRLSDIMKKIITVLR